MNTDEPYILYADKSKSLRGLNKRMLWIGLPMMLLMFAFFGALSHGFSVPLPRTAAHPRGGTVYIPGGHLGFLSWIPWFFVLEFVLLYMVVLRSTKKQSKPIVTLNQEGITVDTMATHIGLIRWDEIKEIRAYNFIYRYVGIVPKDTSALCRRVGAKASWVIRLNDWCIPLYKPFGIFIAPINIPQVYLSITVDELMRTIEAYRLAYAPLPSYGPTQEGVWPPPPDTTPTRIAQE